MLIPTIHDLFQEAGDIDYELKQKDDHISIYLELSSSHVLFPVLTKYALLVRDSLASLEYSLRDQERLLLSDALSLSSQIRSLEDLEVQPPIHRQGWIGEIVTDFLLRHFLFKHRSVLGYIWESVTSPKADNPTASNLDVVFVYELADNKLGHGCGEVKAYTNLSDAKSKAYKKLREAHDRLGNRESEIRVALVALLEQRERITARSAAALALKGDRSFLPSLLHDSTSALKRDDTFADMPNIFTTCTRGSQRIGLQLSISDFSTFFDNFISTMKSQVYAWHEVLEA